jgi:hypothetical protein
MSRRQATSTKKYEGKNGTGPHRECIVPQMETTPYQGIYTRVNWINAIAISVNLRNATIIFNFGKMPLQLCVHLIDAITPTYTIYTSQYTWYLQPYVHTHNGIHQNQQKNINW